MLWEYLRFSWSAEIKEESCEGSSSLSNSPSWGMCECSVDIFNQGGGCTIKEKVLKKESAKEFTALRVEKGALVFRVNKKKTVITQHLHYLHN